MQSGPSTNRGKIRNRPTAINPKPKHEIRYQGADTGPGLKALERLLPAKKVLLKLKEK